MIKKISNKKTEIVLFLLLFLAFILTLKIYLKLPAGFPVVIKRNELGFNFLTQRSRIFNFYILGIIFLVSNLIIERKVEIKEINLKKVLKYVNIIVAVLVFLISIQIYFFNL